MTWCCKVRAARAARLFIHIRPITFFHFVVLSLSLSSSILRLRCSGISRDISPIQSVVNVSGGLLVVETITSVAEGIGDLTINSFGQDVLNNRWRNLALT